MVTVDITRAVIIAAILARRAGLLLIYLTAFVTGAGSALRDTAAMTCVPRRVKPTGPAAGGWLFGLAAVLPFAVNAGTLGIAVLLLTLPSVFQPPSGTRHTRRCLPLAWPWRDMAEGLRWLRQHRGIGDVTITASVISAIDAAWFAVLVLQVIHPGASYLNTYMTEVSTLRGGSLAGRGRRVE